MISLFNKKSVFVKLLVTYCAMSVMASLLIGTLSYEAASRLYTKEIEKDNILLLEQYKALIETEIMTPARKIATEMLFNDVYKDISNFFENDISYGDLYWYNKEVDDYSSRNRWLVRDVYLYNLQENMILSSAEGVLFLDTRDNFWWALNQEELQKNEGWSWQYYENNVLGLRFCQRYPMTKAGEIKGYIVIDVDVNELLEMMESLSANQKGSLLFLDQEGKLIPVTGTGFEELIDTCNLMQQNGGQKLSWGQEDYYVAFSSPLESGWRLAMITSVTDFYASVTYLQRMIFLLTCLCIIVGIVFSICFARKIYSPVKKIVDRLQNGGVKGFLTGNEYEFIDREILHLGESVQELKRMLDDYKPMLEYSTVSGMINRTITKEDIWQQRLDIIGIQKENTCVAAVVIRIRPLLFTIMDEKNLMIFKIHIISLMKQLCGGQCIISEQKSDEIATVLFTEKNDIVPFLHKLEKTFSSNPEGTILIGAGSCYENPTDYHLSYREADRALLYAFFDSSRMMFSWPCFEKLAEPEEDKKGELCREFDRQIRLGNISEALYIIDKVERLTKACIWQYEYMNQMILELVRVFARYCREVHITIETERLEEHFLKVENVQEFLAFFREVMSDAFQKHETDMDNKNEHLVQAVCDYIDHHLDEDISMNMLAEKMGISEGHLSRTFKKLRNRSILDYMTEKRMKEAKRLLEETNLNVEDIASLCGYRTFHYFSRKFKESCGYTPTQYRETKR